LRSNIVWEKIFGFPPGTYVKWKEKGRKTWYYGTVEKNCKGTLDDSILGVWLLVFNEDWGICLPVMRRDIIHYARKNKI